MHHSEDQLSTFTQECLNLSSKTPLTFTPILKGGSDRIFFRISDQHNDNKIHCILISYNTEKKENALYADLARFLKKIGIQAPGILAHDTHNKIIWMEDLGGTDLYSKKDEPWSERLAYYKQVLEQIHILHEKAYDEIQHQDIKTLPGFNLDQYEWEQNYFFENLVEEYFQFKLDAHDTQELGKELDYLKNTLLQTTPAIVHRDFQSQNIILKERKTYLIDFQGMRPGCFFYDLGSLLYDPYVPFSNEERLQLLKHYYELKPHRSRDWPTFCKCFHEASAQRLMQALGAYGFLGLKRNKTSFLKHIPAGLKNLKEATALAETLPGLHSLSIKLYDLQEAR